MAKKNVAIETNSIPMIGLTSAVVQKTFFAEKYNLYRSARPKARFWVRGTELID